MCNCNRHTTLTVATAITILLAAVGAPRARGQCDPQWLPGQGLAGLSGTARAAVVYDDGSGPALYVGGRFTIAGDAIASKIARWDGATWSALGSGMNDWVQALTIYDGELIAGGAFTSAGGTPASRIARWDGTTWSALGSGMDGAVSALTVYNGKLIAGGRFTHAGGTPANYIARWDGTSWSALSTGMAGGYRSRVYALTVYNGELIAGGDFTIAGEHASAYWARWGQCSGDIDCDGDTDHADLGALLGAWDSQPGDPHWNENADLDGNGHVGHGDLGILLGDWGCGT